MTDQIATEPSRRNFIQGATVLAVGTLVAGVAAARGASDAHAKSGRGHMRIPTMKKDECAILLIDHQDMTVGWIKSQPQELVVANVRVLARLGSELGVPLLVTSTMETQIGTNIKAIQETAPKAFAARIKRGGTLNCFMDPAFAQAVDSMGRRKLIMAGLTTDICLFHSVVGAMEHGYEPFVVADACGSMTQLADDVSFARLRQIGATISDTNQTLTELFPDFGTPEGQRAQKIDLEEIVSKLGK